jgi:hypothetical protein
MDSSLKPRRGRKPKNVIVKKKINIEEKTKPIIAHLPIKLEENINDIFVKNNKNDEDLEINKLKRENKELRKELNKKLTDSDKLFNLNEKNISDVNCWWCRYSFTTPRVCLPENIFNDKIQSFGFFCSYNCACAYNVDINDENIHKRSSLLHYLYKKTYNENKEILKAPDWRILKQYGGNISIDEFRDNFLLNTFDYQYIKPPMISRNYQIEKTLKIKNTNKTSEFILKRSKPINTSKYTLETTMGLKKIINVSSD